MAENEENTNLLMLQLRNNRDEFVQNTRWSCTTEQIDDVIAYYEDVAKEGGLEPVHVTGAEVCEEALRQASCRQNGDVDNCRTPRDGQAWPASEGMLDDLYRSFRNFDPETGKNDSQGAWEKIIDQAQINSNTTGLTYRDEENNLTEYEHKLTCGLAMDAGYRFGIENPNADPAPGLTPAQARGYVAEFIADDSKLTASSGLIVGTKLAQGHLEEAEKSSALALPSGGLRQAGSSVGSR